MCGQMTRIWVTARLIAQAVAAMLCASALAAGAFTQPAWADSTEPLKAISSGTKVVTIGEDNWYSYSGEGKVSAAKAANPKVMSVDSFSFKDGGTWFGNVVLAVKKTGTSKLTYKVGSKKHTVTIKVVKYENPFATLKVGSTNLKSKFKKSTIAKSLKAGTLVGKLNVKPAKNWKIKSIALSQGGKTKKVKNGAKIGKSSNGTALTITLKNSRTGRVETCYLES